MLPIRASLNSRGPPRIRRMIQLTMHLSLMNVKNTRKSISRLTFESFKVAIKARHFRDGHRSC